MIGYSPTSASCTFHYEEYEPATITIEWDDDADDDLEYE
jgi:hypothetical protein